MKNVKDNGERKTIWIRRIARIWSLPIIVYALIMFTGYFWSWVTTGVADPYAVEGTSFVEALPPILMFLGILGLGIAWRWERLGGAINLVFLLAVILLLLFTKPITQNFYYSALPYLLSLVVVIPGILFLAYWRQSRKMPTI